MLSKLKVIKNVRNFIDFKCDEDFTMDSKSVSGKVKNTVIYALNGTGKTTISSFLNCFRNGECDESELNRLLSLEAIKSGGQIGFEIEFDQKSNVNIHNPSLPSGQRLFVYNEDFVKKNLDISDFSGNKDHHGNLTIGTVGADEIKLKTLTKNVEVIIEETEKSSKWIKSLLTKNLEKFKKEYKARGNTYDNIFSVDSIGDRKRIEKINEELGSKDPSKLFADLQTINEDFQIGGGEKVLDTTLDYDELESLVGKRYTFEEVEEELELHIKKVGREWIEKGLHHHENETCPFCRQGTDALNVVKIYREFIESEKNKTLTKLGSYKSTIEGIIAALSSNDLHKESLSKVVNDYAKALDSKESWEFYQNLQDKLDGDLKELLEIIVEKENDLENAKFEDDRLRLICNSVKNYITELNQSIDNNNQLIDDINRKLNSTGARKTELRKEIAEKLLVECYNQSEDQREKVTTNNRKTKEIEREIKEEKSKAQTKEIKKAIIETTNILLTRIGLTKYEIGDDFRLNLKVSTGFDVSTHTEIISQGERTVIAFAYFVAQVIQGLDSYEDLSNTTLVIDDPISSTSYNYLHGIGSVIKNLSKYYKAAFQFPGNNSNPQIIITTHNIQFYNILHSNVFNKNKCNFYLLASKVDGIRLKKVTNSKKLSEYMTSLSRLKEYVEEKIDVNVGNDLRKVLETICSFHFVELGPDTLEKIFDPQEVNPSLKLVADDHVHTDFNNHEDPIDSESLRLACKEVLNLVNVKFPGQMEYLNSLN